MRGAIIGFGDVAQFGHWPAYQQFPSISIVAIVDRTPARRRVAEALDASLRTYDSVGALVDAERLDFVDICTPPALHHEPMLRALDAGCHVLCEKPFVIDPTALDRVRERSRAARRSVVPVHNWKYAPIVRSATDLLRAGAIGALRRVHIETSRLRACPTAEIDGTNWRRDPRLSGGGIVMDHGWHAAYLALHWFGEPAALASATLVRAAPDAVEEEADVRLAFPSGEATIALTWNGTHRYNRMRLTGDRGEIAIDDDMLRVAATDGVESATTFTRALSHGSHHEDWFAAMLPDVLAAFGDRRQAERGVDEAASCLRLIRSAYQADLSVAARG